MKQLIRTLVIINTELWWLIQETRLLMQAQWLLITENIALSTGLCCRRVHVKWFLSAWNRLFALWGGGLTEDRNFWPGLVDGAIYQWINSAVKLALVVVHHAHHLWSHRHLYLLLFRRLHVPIVVILIVDPWDWALARLWRPGKSTFPTYVFGSYKWAWWDIPSGAWSSEGIRQLSFRLCRSHRCQCIFRIDFRCCAILHQRSNIFGHGARIIWNWIMGIT